MMTSSEMIKTTNEGVIKQLIMGQIQMTNKHQGINHQQVLYPNNHQFVRGDALAPPEGHNTLLKNVIRIFDRVAWSSSPILEKSPFVKENKAIIMIKIISLWNHGSGASGFLAILHFMNKSTKINLRTAHNINRNG